MKILNLRSVCKAFYLILWQKNLGTIGIIEISRFASYGYDQRCEVFGPKGMLVVNNNSPNGTISHDNLGISRCYLASFILYWN